MKYTKYTFEVETMEGGDIVRSKVIVELTKGSTEAMRMVIEDWDPKADGELRSITLQGITGIERQDDGQADG